jgi:hypothetical protein
MSGLGRVWSRLLLRALLGRRLKKLLARLRGKLALRVKRPLKHCGAREYNRRLAKQLAARQQKTNYTVRQLQQRGGQGLSKQWANLRQQ